MSFLHWKESGEICRAKRETLHDDGHRRFDDGVGDRYRWCSTPSGTETR
jgi:hypothetical protein